MIWIAPPEKDTDNAALEKRLWDAADQFRANSGVKSQEYSAPVLGLIFLRFAEVSFATKRAQLATPSPLGGEWAGVRGDGYPRPSDGRGAGGEGYSGDPTRELSIHGVEKTDETGRLCRLNLAVHGLEGEIKHGGNINSYHDDPHDATGRFDFVLANPPFNVNAVDTAMRVSARRHAEGTPQDLPERQDHERLKDMVGPGRRFPFGLRRTDNAKYLWIQLFHSALNAKGRAGFVMANRKRNAQSCSMKLTDEVRKYAAEQGFAEKEALKKGMEAKSKEFVEQGAEFYANARI